MPKKRANKPSNKQQFSMVNIMSPKDQYLAASILKAIVERDDEQNPGQTGYCDDSETMEIRMLLMRIGFMKDRRKPNR